MKKFTFFSFFLLVALGSTISQGASFYVDSSRPDNSADGTSWATAKKTIDVGYSLLSPGDELYISGGAISKTYYVPSTSLLVFGTANTTISRGIDSGHNGAVLIDWQGSIIPGNSAIRITGNNIKLTGVNDGGIVIRNGEEVGIAIEADYVIVEYCKIHDWENDSVDGRGINIISGASFYNVNHCIIFNCGGYGVFNRGNYGEIHDCQIYDIGTQASFSFANGIELIESHNNNIYSNKVYNCYNKIATDGNCLELFKGSDNNNIYDNEFYNSLDLVEVGDDEAGGRAPQGNKFFRNKLHGRSNVKSGVAYYKDSGASSPSTPDVWYSNLIYDVPMGFNVNYSVTFYGNTFYNCDTMIQIWDNLAKTVTLKNNIFNTASRNGVLNWSNNTTLVHSNNAWWRADNAYVYQDNDKNVRPSNLAEAFEPTGFPGQVNFTDAANANFHLETSNSDIVLEGGVAVGSQYDSDFDLFARPQGSGYTMGAYEFRSSDGEKISSPKNLRAIP
ncbi:MAG: hypothetical protein RAP03_02155 [Candidatus Electryonea clarkiae]|nr:hypothetical protein [Candidatus Electryonea clarkiae]